MGALVLPLKQTVSAKNMMAFEIDNTFDPPPLGDITPGSTPPPMGAIAGVSVLGYGVSGTTTNGSAGVLGNCSGSGAGVSGTSTSGTGVSGNSSSGFGIQGTSQGNDAVNGTSSSPAHAGVAGHNGSGGYGVYGSSPNAGGTGGLGGIGVYGSGAKYAGQFDGSVLVTGQLGVNHGAAEYAISVIGSSNFIGDISMTGSHTVGGNVNVTGDVILSGNDCAEDFDVVPDALMGPGTVMVLTENGALQPSQNAYDKKVAGVVSGAGEYRPGLILGRCDSSQERVPLALVGKVYCKVDAQYGPVEIGDLLTTSPTPGHAMRAADSLKAFGAVIGKALRRLETGQAQIPILAALQ
jgi:hypothetical protein